MAKKYDGNSGIFKGGSEKTALMRMIIPVALAFILFTLSIFFLFIPSVEKQMMDEKRDMIRGLTDTAWSLISQYDRDVKDGRFSLKEAQKRIIKGLHDIRESKDYFRINDMHPTKGTGAITRRLLLVRRAFRPPLRPLLLRGKESDPF